MKTGNRILYALLCCAAYPLSWLPLRVLYIFADILAWLAGSVIGYRRKVIRENLRKSFPGKSDDELRKIEKGFYRWLGDYGVETLKLLTFSPESICKHMEVENPEEISRALGEGRNVVLFLGHYCNWEWVSSLPLSFPAGAVCAQVYHPLHNKPLDRLFYKLRTRFGANNEPMNDIGRFLISHKRQGIPTVTGFIADQRPRWEIHLFVDFLHHDTGVFTGPERMARFLDAEVWFCHMERPRRGTYRLRFLPVTHRPSDVTVFDITRRCFSLLQSNIEEAPQYYLWSHKRWKRSRQDFLDHWGDKAADQLSHL